MTLKEDYDFTVSMKPSSGLQDLHIVKSSSAKENGKGEGVPRPGGVLFLGKFLKRGIPCPSLPCFFFFVNSFVLEGKELWP